MSGAGSKKQDGKSPDDQKNRNAPAQESISDMTIEIRDSETGEAMRTMQTTEAEQREIMVGAMLARAREIYSSQPSQALALVLESVRQTRGEDAIMGVLDDARAAYRAQGQQQPSSSNKFASRSNAANAGTAPTSAANGQTAASPAANNSQTSARAPAKQQPQPQANGVATSTNANGHASVASELWGPAPAKRSAAPPREEKKPAPSAPATDRKDAKSVGNSSSNVSRGSNNGANGVAGNGSSSGNRSNGNSNGTVTAANNARPAPQPQYTAEEMRESIVNEGILEAALEDGSSEICVHCNALLPVRRVAAHYSQWCPVLFPDAELDDDD